MILELFSLDPPTFCFLVCFLLHHLHQKIRPKYQNSDWKKGNDCRGNKKRVILTQPKKQIKDGKEFNVINFPFIFLLEELKKIDKWQRRKLEFCIIEICEVNAKI